MNKSIPLLAVVIGCLVAGSVAEPAMARMGGSYGYGGHMSGFTSSDTMSTSADPGPSTQSFTRCGGARRARSRYQIEFQRHLPGARQPHSVDRQLAGPLRLVLV